MSLPVSTGMIGEYGWENATADSMINSLEGGGNVTLSGAVINADEQYVYLNSSAFAYMPCGIGNSATLYFIAKAVRTTSRYGGTSWGFALCGADASHRVFCGMEMYSSSEVWKLFCIDVAEAKSYTDWGILAMVAENGRQALYFNGKKIAELSQAVDFGFSGLYVNAGAYNGAAPASTGGFGEDIYIKYMAIANVVHSDEEIFRNTAYLQQKYFGSVSADSAKARILALGYMLGYNSVTAESLELLAETYRQGLLRGDNGNGAVVEEYTSTDGTSDFRLDEDGNGISPAATDMGSGFSRVYTDDDGTVTGYIKVYIEPYYDEYVDYYKYIYDGKITVASYTADGTLIGTQFLDYRYSLRESANRINVATAIRVYPSGRFEIDYSCTDTSTGENFSQTEIGMISGDLTSPIGGNYSYTTNTV